MLRAFKQSWFSNVRGDVLAGIVVALALIPEAIAFFVIAGIDPKVGLYASFCIAVITSIVGGRPGMISAATGAMALVLVATVVVVVMTHNLALDGLLGVLLSALFFARKVGDILYIGSELSEDSLHRSYQVVGQVFFTSADQFIGGFDFKEGIDKVTIDLTRAHFWDITAISSLDKVIIKFRRDGAEVERVGMNEASATLVDRFAVHDKPGAVERLMGH